MARVKRTNNIPEYSIISKDFNGFQYCDSYSIVTQTNNSLDKITTDIFRHLNGQIF